MMIIIGIVVILLVADIVVDSEVERGAGVVAVVIEIATSAVVIVFKIIVNFVGFWISNDYYIVRIK
jgi:hypothetical protein